MNDAPLIYVARCRLHRNGANLIQALHVAESFARIGVPTRLYLPPAKGVTVAARLRDFGIDEALDLRLDPWLHTRFGLWPFFVRKFGELRRARGIFTHNLMVSRWLAQFGLKHVLEIHDADRDLIQGGWMPYVIGYHRRRIIDWLVPVSRAAARVLIEAGAEPERVLVAPNAVDLKAYAALSKFDPTRLDHPTFVYLGTLAADRGLHIFDTLAQRGIGKAVLIGEVEPGSGFAMPAGVESHPFVPHHEVPGWYGRSDITLLPYPPHLATADSMSPMKLFEALAAGRPIIASDLPVLRELLEHEKTALLVDPEDVEAWIAAVRRLQSDRGLAVRLAQAAAERARGFSWENREEKIARVCGWL
ncbi:MULTISPECIES: glycosyltransferase family 4 protein [Methylococcus]|uniref:Glycosyltransferase family 4 protein n=1 Tax=Methylococcus capsulatus TaxID=414 RepID=A0ABZ2FAZ4_METCP|nr:MULTISPECIES: glycosyltransferase family 4 protein [Methylococcus]MDF9391311.1 glycosyltransferase [Methylococcus capsulatus]